MRQIKSVLPGSGTLPTMMVDTSLPIAPDVLRRFDVPGPRYTSYPTADRFVEAFGPAQLVQALEQRAGGAGAVGGRAAPLSLYVHVPFCESVCYYCACNKIITRHHERATEYLDALEREVELYIGVLGREQPVSQLHLGGGTPTFLSDGELARLVGSLRRAFRLVPGGEYSIEVDPRTVSAERLSFLAGLGFNRISLGVQDFDPEVQKAVHRIQSFESVAGLIEQARRLGIESVNADLIYGLPRQTPGSFARTLDLISQLRPDRIALYGYAHLPTRFKPQRRIHADELPSGADKLAMLSGAIARFASAGYDYIGMDHFALHTDALAVAKRQGRLHRNFQGYSTQPDCDLIALGVSAIGRIGSTYSQNAKTLPEYYDALRQGQFPVVRGLALSRDDLVRRAVIMALMCQGHVSFESIELSYLIDFRHYFAAELGQLQDMAAQGLVRIETDGLTVSPAGWYVVRGIAMVFDKYLQAERNRERFSRII